MIALSTTTRDLAGAIVLHNTRLASDISTLSRRVSRTATLDGGCVITDAGYSASDRTFSVVEERASTETVDAVDYIFKNYATIMVSCDEGVFLAAPDTVTVKDGKMTLKLLIQEAIT